MTPRLNVTAHTHTGIERWTAKQYRDHLSYSHGFATRGYTWMELQAAHDERHQADAVSSATPAPPADTTKCAYEYCSEIVQWCGVGRRPKYHTDNCRKRAEQDRRRAERIERENQARRQAAEEERERQLRLAVDLVHRIRERPAPAAEAVADWMSRRYERPEMVASLLRFMDTHGQQLGLS